MRHRTRRALAASSAAVVAVVAVGGALGVWPIGSPAGSSSSAVAADTAQVTSGGDDQLLQPMVSMVGAATREVQGLLETARTPRENTVAGVSEAKPVEDTAVPARSGQGRRVVFDISAQRVWLVRADGTAARTYPVSGSKTDNLAPGHFQVYSTSRHATSYNNVETMEYMVRFTTGERYAIGFHDIPVDREGKPVQTHEQLGEPLSSGCIRQRHRDAKALWKFAPVDTPVVVVA